MYFDFSLVDLMDADDDAFVKIRGDTSLVWENCRLAFKGEPCVLNDEVWEDPHI